MLNLRVWKGGNGEKWELGRGQLQKDLNAMLMNISMVSVMEKLFKGFKQGMTWTTLDFNTILLTKLELGSQLLKLLRWNMMVL